MRVGYSTKFTGKFDLSRQLTLDEFNELTALADTPRVAMPAGAPNPYLQWRPTHDGRGLEWDGGEKFYDYAEWLEWLSREWFRPRGIEVLGEVRYQGESTGDAGTLRIVKGIASKVPLATSDAQALADRIVDRLEAAGLLEASAPVRALILAEIQRGQP